LNKIDVLTEQDEYINFKLARATMGSELGRSEEDWQR
jgi:hypothetical protein